MLLSRKEILDCAQKAAKVLKVPNSTIIQLEKIKYELTITASSGIGTIIAKTTIEEEKDDFKMCIDSRIFIETLRKMKSETIQLILGDKVLILKDQSGIQVKIPCVDFSINKPLVQESNNEIVVDFDIFKKYINECGHALGITDNYLNFKAFFNFLIGDGTLSCIASDGYRISKRGYVDKGGSFLLNGVLMKSIINSFENEKITIKQDENMILLRTDSLEVYISRPQCLFCNLSKIVQNEPKYKISFNREELIEKLEIASLVDTTIVLNFSNGMLQMYCNNYANEFDSCIKYTGVVEDMKIGINSEFLLDSLRSINDDNIDIYIDNSKSPIHIFSDEYHEIILPITLR